MALSRPGDLPQVRQGCNPLYYGAVASYTRGLARGRFRGARANALPPVLRGFSLMVQICYKATDFDERAVTVALTGGRVSRINVGRIIEP